MFYPNFALSHSLSNLKVNLTYNKIAEADINPTQFTVTTVKDAGSHLIIKDIILSMCPDK